MKTNCLRFTPAFSPREECSQNKIPRVEPLNRSRRRESALTCIELKVRGLTSAATRLRGRAEMRANVGSDNRQARLLVLLMTTSWIFTGSATAADTSTEFNAANKLYAEGKFAEAAGTYKTILQSGAVSPALYFNYGNAEFKSGNLGRAIAAYRQTVQLTPRDAEVRANLEFARNQVQGPTLRESRWSRSAGWLGLLTLNEWTGLAVAAFWLMFALLVARQIRPSLKTALGGFTRGAVAVAILSCACLGVNAAIHFSRQTAVVVAQDAIARSGPFDEAQNAFTVHNGAELAVLDRRDNWLQVTDGSGSIGWLQRQQVEILPGS